MNIQIRIGFFVNFCHPSQPLGLRSPWGNNYFYLILGMGGCEVRDLPQVENSRRILVKPFRGNVVKYKCRTHYRLFGQNVFHCADIRKWGGGEAPVCTRKFCWKKNLWLSCITIAVNSKISPKNYENPSFFLVHRYNFNSNTYLPYACHHWGLYCRALYNAS